MKNIKKTYLIFWISLLAITMLLFFTLPSICLYYDIDSLNTLVDKVGSLSGISVGGFSLTKLPTLIKSYYGIYVPADFPNNNMPVKIWSTFIFIVIMYAENIIIVNKTLNKIKKDDDAFFNIPIIMQSVITMLVTTLVSLLCVINNNIYYMLVIVVYIIVIIVSLLLLVSTNLVKEHIVSIDKENKVKKKFMSELKTDIEILLNKVNNLESKEKLNKLLEEIKYSVSVSNDKVSDIESRISSEILNIKQIVETNSNTDITNEIEKVLQSIKEREILAKG